MKKLVAFLILILILIISNIFSIFAFGAEKSPVELDLKSKYAILIDAKTGTVLYNKNSNEKAYPASITKILTAIIALEKGNLEDTITMSREAVFSIGRDTCHIALDTDEQIKFKDALYAMMLPSANDASNGIAEHIAGSIPNFAILMNNKAKEIGAKSSFFVNPHGLNSDNHYTTAYDMALITKYALNVPHFREFFSAEKHTIPPTNKQSKPREILSSYKIMAPTKFAYNQITGGKSGYTPEAKNTLVTTSKKGDVELIAVVLGCDVVADRYMDTQAMFDYGFQNYNKIIKEIEDKKTTTITAAVDNSDIKFENNIWMNLLKFVLFIVTVVLTLFIAFVLIVVIRYKIIKKKKLKRSRA